jgi:cysteinyl-tRNA synthetase
MYHESPLSLIGNTPLVRLKRIPGDSRVKILAKIEAANVGGSVKDRVALAMIEAAEASGELVSGKTVIEATSGNTGVGLAMVCAVKGHPLTLIMPESASEERKRIMRAFGARLLLTPGRLSTDGAIEEAYRMAREEPDRYVLMDQFNNPASIEAHYRGTAMEIWEATCGELTHVVAALGTSGTAMGLAGKFRELAPEVCVAAVEPYAGHRIQGLKNMQESYPPGIYDKKHLDRILHVEDPLAFDLARRMAREEGLLVGMSTGAALGGALQLAAEIEEGTIVFIAPDSGERYLSTTLFAEEEHKGPRVFDMARGRQTSLTAAGEVAGFFTPGPGLDDPGELEPWRRVVLLDVLTRYQEWSGEEARALVGLADMDDRVLDAARTEGRDRKEFAAQRLGRISEFAELLGVGRKVEFTLTGGSLEKALDLCRKLLARGMAYEKLRSVYFDVARDKDYGRLGRMDMEHTTVGKTVDLADYVKENPRDFTLLKRASLADLKRGDVLETEWGKVRPSWFLQHAALALEKLDAFSAVLVGEVHQFPHMENFRAIWQQAAGARPGAWMVARPVMGREEDESGEVPGLWEALAMAGEDRVAGRILRMWLLSTSYRKPLVFSLKSLEMWARNWRRIQDLYASLHLAAEAAGSVSETTGQAVFELKQGLTENLENDLGLHHFWPALFDFARRMNTALVEGRISGAGARAALDQLLGVDRVMGVLDHEALPVPVGQWPAAVAELVEKRATARRSKDFAAADELRDEIRSLGFRVDDTPQGPRLFPLT